MLDFDLLSEVNRAYGQDMGDAVLKRAASIVLSVAPSPRLVFRYGGEEFVLLAEAHNAEARGLAETVRAEIAAQNGLIPAVTVSCGVAEVGARRTLGGARPRRLRPSRRQALGTQPRGRGRAHLSR